MCISQQHNYLLAKIPQYQDKYFPENQTDSTLGDLALICSVLYRTNKMLMLIALDNTKISLNVLEKKFLL